MTGALQACLRLGKNPTITLTGSVSPAGSNQSLPNLTGYNQTFTVTASGGTAPYTYAASWQQGGVGLNIGSAATSAPTVTSPGATNAERFGTMQIIINDAAGHSITLTVDIDVVWGTPI